MAPPRLARACPFNSPSVWSAGGTGHCHKQSKKVESLILICQSQQKRNTLCLPVKGHVSLHSIAETASRVIERSHQSAATTPPALGR